MQNIIEICKEFGMEVPEEKREEFEKKVLENYRTKKDYDKAVEKRDEYKESLDDVQGKLEKFKDVDIEDLQGQITTLTKELSDERAERAKDAERVELEKTINKLFESVDEKGNRLYDFMNDITEEHYRNALMEELEKDSAKGKSVGDIFKSLITDEDGKQKDGIFVDKADANRARFTKPGKSGLTKPGAKVTPAELMKMKNENPDLDFTQYM